MPVPYNSVISCLRATFCNDELKWKSARQNPNTEFSGLGRNHFTTDFKYSRHTHTDGVFKIP